MEHGQRRVGVSRGTGSDRALQSVLEELQAREVLWSAEGTERHVLVAALAASRLEPAAVEPHAEDRPAMTPNDAAVDLQRCLLALLRFEVVAFAAGDVDRGAALHVLRRIVHARWLRGGPAARPVLQGVDEALPTRRAARR